MIKVLLVNSNLEVFPYPVAPLGISLVASSLKEKFDVKVFDAAFKTSDDLVALLQEYNPDFVGVGLRNIDNVTMRSCKWYLEDVKNRIIETIRKTTKVPIIVGGSGFSIAPKPVLNYLQADYGVIGEAENILPGLIHNLNEGIPVNMPNVISKEQNNVIIADRDNESLNLPKANIDLFIDIEPYKKRGSYPLQTKRGCTHKCIYCSYPNIEGKTYRLRPVSDIVDEIQEVQRRIPDITFEFVDSTFNSPLKHAIDICKEIIHRDLKVGLRTMGVNPGEVTDELILLMKKAGFTQIDCTPDSASKQMIKNYRKNFSKNRLINCAQIIRIHDMPTMWFFMLGGPGETEETILETFEFIDEHIFEEDMVHITEGIRIIPNTELYDIAVREGVISKNDRVIDPMFYVNPKLGKERLTGILEREISKRNNVLNSIDTTPTPELMQAAIQYRMKNKVQEPMFRTLLRVQNSLKI
ncbi:MAG: radical SAM protein [Bacteroidetes bacterium]|nr:radical SAM protein [Bacteroidota bacterium]